MGVWWGERTYSGNQFPRTMIIVISRIFPAYSGLTLLIRLPELVQCLSSVIVDNTQRNSGQRHELWLHSDHPEWQHDLPQTLAWLWQSQQVWESERGWLLNTEPNNIPPATLRRYRSPSSTPPMGSAPSWTPRPAARWGGRTTRWPTSTRASSTASPWSTTPSRTTLSSPPQSSPSSCWSSGQSQSAEGSDKWWTPQLFIALEL